MNKQLSFLSNGFVVTVNYQKKRYPSQSYSQTFINFKVTCQGNEEVLYEAELDDNYMLSNFENLSLFYIYLSRNKKKDVLGYNNGDQIVVLVKVSQNEFEREVLQLNKIQMVDLPQYEALVSRQNFYSEEFKTKIINKIVKTVKNYYKQKNQEKEQTKKEKKAKANALQSQVLFKIQNDNSQYRLNHLNPFAVFFVSDDSIEYQEFKVKIDALKNDKLYVYVQYLEKATNQQMGITRWIQFGRSYNSSFWIQQGHVLAIARQDGQLIIKNASTNNGKLFFEESFNQDKELIFKITISLKQL